VLTFQELRIMHFANPVLKTQGLCFVRSFDFQSSPQMSSDVRSFDYSANGQSWTGRT
jgi:hypothetical protein